MHVERTETYRVPIEQLWPLVSNTDSLNRELGLPAVTYSFTPMPRGGASVKAKMKISGINLEWEEFPYEWVYPRRLSVRRVYSKGPFKEFRCIWKLDPDGASTRMSVIADLEPDGLTGKVLAAALAKRNIDQIFDVTANFEKFLLKEAESPYPKRFNTADINESALAEGLKQLKSRPVAPAMADRLAALIRTEVDERIRDIRPFALADSWGVDRIDVLKLCLYATRTGLLELRWHVICPRCHGSKGEHDTMKKLSTAQDCNSCNIRFKVDLDQRIEARFTPSKSIREIAVETWCFGGPMNTPHVFAQFHLEPGEARTAEMSLPNGRYEIRRAGGDGPAKLQIGQGGAEAELSVVDKLGGSIALAPSGKLKLKNTLDAPTRVAIEKESDERAVATAAAVTTLQEFRDLYATDALAQGVELAVGSLAILFSDLKGSTAMYDKIGDAPAYAVVRRHFEFMTDHIRRHRGAIVKTMGDAVMAVFRYPADAVRCALAVQTTPPWDPHTRGIKIGIHYGPLLAVTSVDYLDYFGSTVNIAQRTQSQSLGADVVITEAVLNAPGVMAAYETQGAHESSFRATLKGFENAFTLHRLVFGKPGETNFEL